jgi:uncharacterized membrane protein YfcA
MLDALSLGLLALFLAFLNDAMGGGYGTLSSPLLLVLGYAPKVVVPAILFSEVISEYWSGLWHMRFRNVNYRTFGITTIGGVIGIGVAVFAIGMFLTATAAKEYISGVAIVMGLVAIVTSSGILRWQAKIREKTNAPLTGALGVICGFNKSSTGGGYGPLSTPGFMLLGLEPARAVGTTIVTKATACLISILLWAAMVGVDWSVAVPMAVGAFVGAPFASWLNNALRRRIPRRTHGVLVGALMTALGTYALLKTIGLV